MIIGYTGLVGMGKTMLAVREAVGLARRRRAYLVSNIKINAPDLDVIQIEVGDDGLEGIPDILARARGEGRGVVILVDEIGIVLPSRFWERGMSIDLMWACSQSRKLGADLVFTCQHVAQLDAFLRRITDWIWRVKAVPHPSIERRESGKRPWFFLASRWRPADIDTERPEKRLSRISWWGGLRYRREWEGLYDTDELVRPPEHLRGRKPRGPARTAPAMVEPVSGPPGPSGGLDSPPFLATDGETASLGLDGDHNSGASRPARAVVVAPKEPAVG